MSTFNEIDREIKLCKAALLKIKAANYSGINRELLLAQSNYAFIRLKENVGLQRSLLGHHSASSEICDKCRSE